MSSYSDFVSTRLSETHTDGIPVVADRVHDGLYPFQRIIVARALELGRYCIFADTGLGKTAMQAVWADHVSRHTGGRVLIVAPLAVAQQTVAEAARFGVTVEYARHQHDSTSQIVITNYDMLAHFDPARYVGIVLDESSILKHEFGAHKQQIVSAFCPTPFKLACTATPSPNDFTELGNHYEFLGVKSRAEMLSEFFVHDAAAHSDWRLKKHGRRRFWEWIGTWSSVIQHPRDMGFDDHRFDLLPLSVEYHEVELDQSLAQSAGFLFPMPAVTLSEQRAVRRQSTQARVEVIRRIVEQTDHALIWCETNDEADAIEAGIEGAVQIAGCDDREVKAERMTAFARGEIATLVTKPKIAGFGMNWQVCNCVVFAGVSHSFEQTYQAIRRCYRFGQTRPVTVHFLVCGGDAMIVENYRRKEAEHHQMRAEMVRCLNGNATTKRWDDYEPTQPLEVPAWLG